MLPCALTLPRFGDLRPSRVTTASVRTRTVAPAWSLRHRWVAVAALFRSVRRFEVTGSSMAPALRPGDRVVVVRVPWRLQPWPKPGDIVAVRDPRLPSRILVKRVVRRRPGPGHARGRGRPPRNEHGQPDIRSRAEVVGGRAGGVQIRPS